MPAYRSLWERIVLARPTRRMPRYQQQPSLLEVRELLAGVTATMNPIRGELTIRGTDANDSVLVRASGNQVLILDQGVPLATTYDLASLRSVIIDGAAGNDNLKIESSLGPVPAFLWGGADNDTLTAGAGATSLYGGSGIDQLIGGVGFDRLFGGDDRIASDGAADLLNGGDGDDLLYIDSFDTPRGGNGTDTALAVTSSLGLNLSLKSLNLEVVYGSDYGDTLSATGATWGVTVFANGGDDIVNGGDGADSLSGGVGRDTLAGYGGADKLFGNKSSTADSAADILNGGLGDDTLYADSFDLNVSGGAGYDSLVALPGSRGLTINLRSMLLESATGSENADQLNASGATWPVTLDGKGGNDTLTGGTFNDVLNGGDGDDTLLGLDGADTLQGGLGRDLLKGGAGDDQLRGGVDIADDQTVDTFFRGTGNDSVLAFPLDVSPSSAPQVSWSGFSVLPNASPVGRVVTYVSSQDNDVPQGDAVSLSFIDPSGLFQLVNNRIQLKTALAPDTWKSYVVTVRATDEQGITTDQNITIEVEASTAARAEQAKLIGQAMYAYHEVFNQFPGLAIDQLFDTAGTINLSWRVHILPYLGYDALYRQFHLNEPWNSPNNLPLLDQMPDIFRSRGLSAGGKKTGFQVLRHASAYDSVSPQIGDVIDGLHDTILFVETTASAATEWTKPNDIAFDPARPLAGLKTLPTDSILVTTVEGTVRELNPTITADNFKALATWNSSDDLTNTQYANAFKNWDAADNAEVSRIKLKQLMIAMHNFHDVYNNFVPNVDESALASGIYRRLDDNGKPLLSWRVYLLPYLGYNNLFNEFHLYESWDSPHNLPLAAKMPDIFRSRGLTPGGTSSGFQILMGNDAYKISIGPVGADPRDTVGPRYGDGIDGMQNIIGILELPADKALPWTQWADFNFDPLDPFAKVGAIPADGLHVAMMDGSVKTLNPAITPTNFKSLISWQGGEAFSISETANSFLDWTQPDDVTSRRNKLQEVAIAMHNFQDVYQKFPPFASYPIYWNAVTNRPNLSWRVQILPYLGYSSLYNQFHFDEAWDSPNNLPLLDKMPEVFRTRGVAAGANKTALKLFIGDSAYRYRTVTLNGGIVGYGPRYGDAWDGASNTILAIELLADQAIEWTRPDDIDFNPDNPLAGIGTIPSDGLQVVMLGGAVNTINPAVTAENFKKYVTWQGGELTSGYAETSNTFLDWQDGSYRRVYGSPPVPVPAQVSNDFNDRRNKLRFIGFGLHNHAEVYDSLFVYWNDWRNFDQTVRSGMARPNLSWRVHILPYIDEGPLYNQFHLDEPWDSPNNLPLLDKMPEIFRSRGLSKDTHKTGFQLFRGNGASSFGTATESYGKIYGRGTRFRDITDGTSNTIGVVETAPEMAVDWTNPDGDIAFDPANPMAGLGELKDFILALMFDGNVRVFHPSIDPAQFKKWVTIAGGERTNQPPAAPSLAPGFFSTPRASLLDSETPSLLTS